MCRPEWSAPARALAVVTLGAALWIGPGCGGLEAPYEELDGDSEEWGALQDDGAALEGDVLTTASVAGELPTGHCLAGITDYDKPGPFTYKRTFGLVNMWIPNVPKGYKVPMVHLSNGTGGICAVYAPVLERLASHGFLALCFQSPLTGTGDLGMIAFETALKTYPDLADHRFGSVGHSQGGMAALVTLQYAEHKWGSKGIYAGLAMQPASGFGLQPLTGLWPQIYAKIKSPVFMFSGLVTDGLVPTPWVQAAYLVLNKKTEAYHWMRVLSLHIPTPDRETQQIAIPWFRWKLLGDRKACEHFKAIPKKDPLWLVRAQKNVQPCN